MRLYADYLEEINDTQIKYNDDFFFTYKILDTHVYLENVFIKKEKRNNGKMEEIFRIVDNMAKENDLNFVTSSICINTKDEIKERTHYLLTKNSYKEYDRDDNMIYYCKEIL